MAASLNLVKRPGTTKLYVRQRVPLDVVDLVGRKELWESTGTADRARAKAKATEILAGWHRRFEDLRRRRNPVPGDLTAAGWLNYLSGLDRDARERQSFPNAERVDAAKRAGLAQVAAREERTPLADMADMLDYMVARDAPAMARQRNEAYAAALRKHLATGETALIASAVDGFIQSAGLLIEKGSDDYRALAQIMIRSELEWLRRAAERDQGDWTGEPKDPAIKPPTPGNSPKTAAPGEGILDLFEVFRREQGAKAKASTWASNRKSVEMFADFLGGGAHISAINRVSVRAFKQGLLQYPTHAGNSREFRDLSFQQAIDRNATVGRPTLELKTINKVLGGVSAFATWLVSNSYLDANPFDGSRVAVDRKRKTVRPFTADQMRTIFTSPLFTGCAGTGREHEPGTMQIRDWRYWAPWVAIYSGARLGEILQLTVADVRQSHGVWVMHIIDAEEGQGLKTEGSARVVPLHRELIRLGFVDHVKAMRAKGEARVFPDAMQNSRGYFDGPSKFFNGYFAAIGVKVDRSRNFHSFRHGAADAFRRGGYLDEQHGVLLGHGKASTTGRYGVLPEGTLAARKAMIEAISYPVFQCGDDRFISAAMT